MSLSIDIKFVFEEQDANGETCHDCGKLLTDKKYILMMQTGEAEYVSIKAFDATFCRECAGDDEGTKELEK